MSRNWLHQIFIAFFQSLHHNVHLTTNFSLTHFLQLRDSSTMLKPVPSVWLHGRKWRHTILDSFVVLNFSLCGGDESFESLFIRPFSLSPHFHSNVNFYIARLTRVPLSETYQRCKTAPHRWDYVEMKRKRFLVLCLNIFYWIKVRICIVAVSTQRCSMRFSWESECNSHARRAFVSVWCRLSLRWRFSSSDQSNRLLETFPTHTPLSRCS